MFIKESIKRHYPEKETLRGNSSVEDPRYLFFLDLNVFVIFCFELFFLFCHLCSEKFSWKDLVLQTRNGSQGCYGAVLYVWLFAIYLDKLICCLPGGLFTYHELSSQNLSQKRLCYSKSHCWCYVLTWMMVKARYRLNLFVIWLFEDFVEGYHDEWYAPWKTKCSCHFSINMKEKNDEDQ